jgi:8-oxo-dGTP pyrophosphatase MutT (NUDIX family)
MHRVIAGVLRDGNRILLCLRSRNRSWYPNAWDLPGGHVEAGETQIAALTRELVEELGVVALSIACEPLLRMLEPGLDLDIRLVEQWEGEPRTVDRTEHEEVRWCSYADLMTLPLVDERLRRLLSGLLPTPRMHVAAVLPAESVEDVEVLRRRWDPVMAAAAPPHLTVAYPEEAPDVALLRARTASATAMQRPFAIQLGGVRALDGGRGGVFLNARDVDLGWAQLRRRILQPPFLNTGIFPHVTIAHPRTALDGPAAYAALRTHRPGIRIVVTELVLTATSHPTYEVVERFPLTGSNAAISVTGESDQAPPADC